MTSLLVRSGGSPDRTCSQILHIVQTTGGEGRFEDGPALPVAGASKIKKIIVQVCVRMCYGEMGSFCRFLWDPKKVVVPSEAETVKKPCPAQ